MPDSVPVPTPDTAATVHPHPTLLRKGFLLCIDSDVPVAPDNNDICPVHKSMACVAWFVPWADAQRAAKEAPNA